jgi:hypothetical protein
MRVDPAALSTAAAEVARLGAVVAASRRGADGQVTALSGRAGDLGSSVLDQWRQAGVALDRLETDFRVIGQALHELATYFADLNQRAVPGPR